MICESCTPTLLALGIGANNSPSAERLTRAVRGFLYRAKDLKTLCVGGSPALRLKEGLARQNPNQNPNPNSNPNPTNPNPNPNSNSNPSPTTAMQYALFGALRSHYALP